MRAPVALAVVLLLVAGGVTHPGGAVPVDRTAGAAASGFEDATWLGTTIDIQVRANGDARWTVTFRFALPTEDEAAAFNQSEAGPDAAVYRAFVERASAATGREMSFREVERDRYIEDGNGSVVLEFTWTNFARIDGDTVVLGDVFRTETGTWFPRLDNGQTLIIRAPPGYAAESAGAPFEDGRFEYEGPRSFDGDVVNATFVPAGPFLPIIATLDLVGIAGIAGAVVALLGVVALLAFRGRSVPWPRGRTGGEDDAPTGAATDSAAGEEPSAPVDGEGDAADPLADVDEELLSDEERVEVLLEANGGRMKQGDIVRETGWSNAKVSQLLSSMAEEERLDKLRLGRENLITLPDEDVGDTGDRG